MRWGSGAGRKTMVATTVLLFILSGPVKVITYLLFHGLLGLTMGTFWRLKTSWGASVFPCSLVRARGALSNAVIASYLIRENILALMNFNSSTSIYQSSHAQYQTIYLTSTFWLLLLNFGFFVFLLHLLYAIFFTGLGMKSELRLPKWLEAAI
ncbi:hypothetical protein CDL12_01347 [Handroanthus impetiginosus]|uniref:Uncharacterized protein n=1 Tax=Handroanthus impetiginosus TaxID=429701 RepID=A0A2G9I847_9LAMI|nr:hypothetical protein CDL12_01347 [Handroanthus impetiginosus]